VLVTKDAVWVASTKPYSIVRIDPATNKIAARVAIPGEACSGIAAGFGKRMGPQSVAKTRRSFGWIPRRTQSARHLPCLSTGDEGGITASGDSVWMVTDKKGTLSRIDPATNKVRQRIAIPLGSYNPIYSHGVVWISGVEQNNLTAVDAASGKLLHNNSCWSEAPIPQLLVLVPYGPLNQGTDPSGRVDEKRQKSDSHDTSRHPGERWRHRLWI